MFPAGSTNASFEHETPSGCLREEEDSGSRTLSKAGQDLTGESVEVEKREPFLPVNA